MYIIIYIYWRYLTGVPEYISWLVVFLEHDWIMNFLRNLGNGKIIIPIDEL